MQPWQLCSVKSQRPKDKELCTGLSGQSNCLSPFCPAAVSPEMLHGACKHTVPNASSPLPHSEDDKGILSLFDIRFTDWGKLRGEKNTCFLTYVNWKGLERQQFTAWNASNIHTGPHEHRSDRTAQSATRARVKPSPTPCGKTANLAPEENTDFSLIKIASN